METKDILKELRKEKGVTGKVAAEGCGIPYKVYQMYESGQRNIGVPALIKLADYYGCTTDYLLGRPVPPPPTLEDLLSQYDLAETEKRFLILYLRIEKKYRECLVDALENAARSPDNKCVVVYLPTSELPVSAGTGVYMDDYNDWEKKTYIDTGEYRHLARCFVLRVKGDSMEPEFTDGDFIAVDPELIPEEGEIGVYILDGEGYVKVLGKDFLHSLNEAYDDIPMNDSIHGCGKVIGTVVPAV